MKIMKKIFACVFCLFLPVFGLSIEIKPLKAFTLSPTDGIIIEKADSFVVTEDNRILIVDSKASNIKIFDMAGKRTGIFGRKGMGPNEFIRPRAVAYKDPWIAFVDFGRKSIFLYSRDKGESFKFTRKFLCLYLGYDFHLIDDRNILVAGDKYDENKRLYSLYNYNFITGKSDFILPSETAYGYTSIKKFLKDSDDKIAYIGYHHYIDFSETNFFLVWQGDLSVVKIDRKSKNISRFGEKTGRYVKPYVKPEVVKAFQQKNNKLIYMYERDLSMVRDIFVTKYNKVGVVYTGPYKKNGNLPVMLQLYTEKGKFIKEVEVLDSKASSHYEVYSYFKKSDNRIFILDTETTEKFDQSYKMHPFQVEE